MKRALSAALIGAMLLAMTACASPAALLKRPDPTPTPAQQDSALSGSLRKYVISFDENGGTLVEGELTQRVPAGEIPAPPVLAMPGYELSGWEPGLTAADGSIVYVAQWIPATYSPEELYAEISPSVAEIIVSDDHGDEISLGSGFFIDDQGTLVTNYHVIEGGYSAAATLSDGMTRRVSAVRDYDAAIDLAILEVDVTGNDYLLLSDEPVRTGEAVYAIGSSLGLTSTFSGGIVSTASREYDGVNYIQTTAPISHGNSGGPLVDIHGRVIGVNTMTMTDGQNLNFALDIRELENLSDHRSLTMAEFWEETASSYSDPADQSGYFYDEIDQAELEPNDTPILADSLSDGDWIAGEVHDIEDLDWYYLSIDEPMTVLFEVAPYYYDDDEQLLCGVYYLTDDDFDILDVLQPTDELTYEIEDSLEIDLDPGIYFLVVTVPDDYPYDEPLYYAARAAW